MDKLVEIATGEHLLGHVVDGLGHIIDDGAVQNLTRLNIWTLNVKLRCYYQVKCNWTFINGYKIVDSMLPIGRGQRELIIGDRRLVNPLLQLILF